MDLGEWVRELLKDIHTAAKNNENYDLHLEASVVDEISNEYEKAIWIDIIERKEDP